MSSDCYVKQTETDTSDGRSLPFEGVLQAEYNMSYKLRHKPIVPILHHLKIKKLKLARKHLISEPGNSLMLSQVKSSSDHILGRNR